MDGTADTPFGPELKTIPLARAPLASVLVQVRFSPVLKISDPDFITPFQEAIAAHFPVTSSDIEIGIDLTQNPPVPRQSTIWRFSAVDPETQEPVTTVSLSTGFVALETRRYETHPVFFDQLASVLNAVKDWLKPAQVQRAGVRYIQRLVDGDDLEAVPSLFIAPIVGVAASAAAENLDLCLTQVRHQLGEGSVLTARWGVVPAGLSPEIVAPIDLPSWVFDIDVFDEQLGEVNPEELHGRLLRYSRAQYRYFRWSVTHEFLRRFGASEEDLTELEREGK